MRPWPAGSPQAAPPAPLVGLGLAVLIMALFIFGSQKSATGRAPEPATHHGGRAGGSPAAAGGAPPLVETGEAGVLRRAAAARTGQAGRRACTPGPS